VYLNSATLPTIAVSINNRSLVYRACTFDTGISMAATSLNKDMGSIGMVLIGAMIK
jgi:hypothetical protein